jgi:hypothetical protein
MNVLPTNLKEAIFGWKSRTFETLGTLATPLTARHAVLRPEQFSKKFRMPDWYLSKDDPTH